MITANMRTTWRRALALPWLFIPAFLIGVFLRFHGLFDQILLDDEWHSLNFVLDKTLGTVLTTHGLGANCIPQNVVHWLLLHTVGWAEWTLYLPSIFFGALGLLIFPRLVARLTGRNVAVLFSYAFALSPCITFYSRIVRPYSTVLFFGFLALLLFTLWIREGRPRHLWAYVLCGFVAVYFHLYAALPVFSPLAALLIWAIVRRHRLASCPWISPKILAGAGLLLALLLILFLGPAHWRNPWWLHSLGQRSFTLEGLWEFLSLLAGTRLAGFKLMFVGLAVVGLQVWMKRDFRSGLVLLAPWAAFCLLVVCSTQDNMHAGIQIARYNIVLFPVTIWLAAIGLDHLLERLFHVIPGGIRLGAGILWIVAPILAGSSIWQTHARPNNFMHHSAFQDSYAPFDWSRSRRRALVAMPQMADTDIPALYAQLAVDPAVPGIIEYPMLAGDSLNYYYFYQRWHRKPVAIGYIPDRILPPLPSRDDYISHATPLDYILGRAGRAGYGNKLRFRNLVPLTNPSKLCKYHGWVLIIHLDILKETLRIRDYQTDVAVTPPPWLEKWCTTRLGPPLASGMKLQAWRIP